VLNAYEVTCEDIELDPLILLLNEDINYYDKTVFAKQNAKGDAEPEDSGSGGDSSSKDGGSQGGGSGEASAGGF